MQQPHSMRDQPAFVVTNDCSKSDSQEIYTAYAVQFKVW